MVSIEVPETQMCNKSTEENTSERISFKRKRATKTNKDPPSIGQSLDTPLDPECNKNNRNHFSKLIAGKGEREVGVGWTDFHSAS